MSKVKANLFFVYKLTCLFNMSTKNLTKSCLKKMSSRVVTHNRFSSVSVNACSHCIANGNNTRFNRTAMKIHTVGILCCIIYNSLNTVGNDNTCIGNLSARCCIKRCFVKNYCTLFACTKHIDRLTVGIYNSQNLCFSLKIRIACKNGFISVNLDTLALPRICTCILTGSTCSSLLVCKKLVKPVLINSHSSLLQNILC